jgi:predicted acyltransferase
MTNPATPELVPKRLLSIDALRGFDMLWIIGGSEVIITVAKACPNSFFTWLAKNFDHEWGVFRFYDLIMPLFLFIVGVVMPVAFKNRSAHHESKSNIYTHVLIRVFKLYILGLVASGHLLDLNISTLHLWTDTLHAIAVGYLVSSILILEVSRTWQYIIVVMLLLAYSIIMTQVPVPGHAAGVFEKDLNLALYVDNKVLGHFQEGSGWTYILTNMTFICSVMLGVFAGNILMSGFSEEQKIKRLIVTGVCCIAGGLIWSLWFPIIHHIWTSSLVLFAGGWSYLLLALFYYLIDIRGYRRWSYPFKVIGVNAIAVYVATHLFNFSTIAAVFVGGFAKWLGEWYNVLLSFAALLVVWLILLYMYKNRTFLKV